MEYLVKILVGLVMLYLSASVINFSYKVLINFKDLEYTLKNENQNGISLFISSRDLIAFGKLNTFFTIIFWCFLILYMI